MTFFSCKLIFSFTAWNEDIEWLQLIQRHKVFFLPNLHFPVSNNYIWHNHFSVWAAVKTELLKHVSDVIKAFSGKLENVMEACIKQCYTAKTWLSGTVFSNRKRRLRKGRARNVTWGYKWEKRHCLIFQLMLLFSGIMTRVSLSCCDALIWSHLEQLERL